MIVKVKEKVLVAHRRLFPQDHPRFFIGEIEAYSDGLLRVSGHTWLVMSVSGEIQRKEDRRIKIISLASGSLLTHILPSHIDLNDIHFNYSKNSIVMQDGHGFTMDLSDRVASSNQI